MTSAEHAHAAMRTVWPLVQHVEENGLGAVYVTVTRFVL